MEQVKRTSRDPEELDGAGAADRRLVAAGADGGLG